MRSPVAGLLAGHANHPSRVNPDSGQTTLTAARGTRADQVKDAWKDFYDREVLARRCSARICCLSQASRRAIERVPPACARPAAAATTSATRITRSWVRRSHAMRAATLTTIAARIAFCRPLDVGDLRAVPVGSDEVTVFQTGPRRTAL